MIKKIMKDIEKGLAIAAVVSNDSKKEEEVKHYLLSEGIDVFDSEGLCRGDYSKNFNKKDE